MKNQAVFLMGPTAVGKTEIALRLAAEKSIEIISVDSALIYTDLDIGTAKPTLDELAQVPHHLINIISPLGNYSVVDFIHQTNNLIVEINGRNKLPVLVGGTMMYFNALINGISTLPESNPIIRSQLQQEFINNGNCFMYEKLKAIDPLTANKIAINDIQRIERALEVYYITGEPISKLQTANTSFALTNCKYLSIAILPKNRQIIHERINQRFLKMLDLGLVDEVKQLQDRHPELTSEYNSMRCVGYRQVWEYLLGSCTYNELIERGQAATRQLAKRQITWLRGMSNNINIDNDDLNSADLFKQLNSLVNKFLV